MMVAGFQLWAMVAAVSFATAGLVLLFVARTAEWRARRIGSAAATEPAEAEMAFLFDDETLLDATPAAYALLATASGGGTERARLSALLRPRFPGLDAALRELAERAPVELRPADGGADLLRAEWRSGYVRISLVEAAADGSGPAAAPAERQHLAAVEAELSMLRGIARSAPMLIWKQDGDGTVVWANDAYFGLAAEILGDEVAYSWPPPALFELAACGQAESVTAPVRTALRAAEDAPPRWFECQGYQDGAHALFFAVPADSLVRAEEALREFVQTLSKTFAHLPIGLAIFDRARRLALFNPALTDLTSLDVAFLAGRPSLFAFLDRLRDNRQIPEPRDYGSWRKRMADLEAAAAGGFVQENWALPSGQTYRVTGRPHPDGAVAFLFEDISAEVSLTRRFRSEIELGQTVFDSLDEAIAVFSAGGVLSLSNAAYADLWGVDTGPTLTETGIVEATRLWQSRVLPTPIWGDVRDFVAQHGERVEWSGQVTMADGRELACRFKPLPGGATLVGFREAEGAVAAPADPAPTPRDATPTGPVADAPPTHVVAEDAPAAPDGMESTPGASIMAFRAPTSPAPGTAAPVAPQEAAQGAPRRRVIRTRNLSRRLDL